MMRTGRGYPSASVRSTRSCSMAASSRSSTTAWTRGRSASTTRGVKALATRPRSRVWSGGSRDGNGRISRKASDIGPDNGESLVPLSELLRRSRRTARQSACRDRTHSPAASLRWIGSRSRNSA